MTEQSAGALSKLSAAENQLFESQERIKRLLKEIEVHIQTFQLLLAAGHLDYSRLAQAIDLAETMN